MESGNIIFGLGTGRCGTSSLAYLLNSQPNTVCFHEVNPSCMAWRGSEMTVASLIRDFEYVLSGGERCITADFVSPNRLSAMPRLHELENVSSIGDVASYYLPYVENILSIHKRAKFICMKRDIMETINSFIKKLSELPDMSPRNHWAIDGDRRWRRDQIWDKCFPKIDDISSTSLSDYVEAYYNMYYKEAERLRELHPENFMIFDLDMLNSTSGRFGILEFAMPNNSRCDVESHRNMSKS